MNLAAARTLKLKILIAMCSKGLNSQKVFDKYLDEQKDERNNKDTHKADRR